MRDAHIGAKNDHYRARVVVERTAFGALKEKKVLILIGKVITVDNDDDDDVDHDHGYCDDDGDDDDDDDDDNEGDDDGSSEQ